MTEVRRLVQSHQWVKNTISHVWNSTENVSIRMDWRHYLLRQRVEDGFHLKKLWSFHKASPKRMKCFINWFALFPSRPFSTLASITFLSVRHSVEIVSSGCVLHIKHIDTNCAQTCQTNSHTSTELKSLVLFFLLLVTPRKTTTTERVFTQITPNCGCFCFDSGFAQCESETAAWAEAL